MVHGLIFILGRFTITLIGGLLMAQSSSKKPSRTKEVGGTKEVEGPLKWTTTATKQQKPRLVEVWIIWCDRKGRLRRKQIDIKKVGGLWWDEPNGTAIGNDYVHPKNGSTTLGKCDSTGPAGDTCCWWDGSQWRCPDDFDA